MSGLLKGVRISVQLEPRLSECRIAIKQLEVALAVYEYCFIAGITMEFVITMFKSLFSNALIYQVSFVPFHCRNNHFNYHWKVSAMPPGIHF